MKEFLQVGALVIGTVYIIALMATATQVRFRCEKTVYYNIDYIFPARQISCWLYREVK